MKRVPWQWFFVFVLMFLSILALGVITFAGLQAKELLEDEVFRRNRTLTFQIPSEMEKSLSNWLNGSLEKVNRSYSNSGDFLSFSTNALRDSAIHSIHFLDRRIPALYSADRASAQSSRLDPEGNSKWVIENPSNLLGEILTPALQKGDGTEQIPLNQEVVLDLKLMQGHGGNLKDQNENFAFWYFPLVDKGTIEGYLILVFDTSFLRKLIRAFVRRYPSVVVEITGLGPPFYLTETGAYEGVLTKNRQENSRSIGPVALSDFFKPAQVRVHYPSKWDSGGSTSFESYRVRYFISRYENLTSFVLAPFCFAILGLILLYGKMRKSQTQIRIQNDWIENIAHDLQTPIHAIGSVLDLLKTQKEGVDSANLIRLIRLELARMTVSTRVFMQLARGMDSTLALPRVERSLKVLIDEALETIKLIHLGKEPVFEIPEQGLETKIQVEPGSFRDMLINLLDNACKYSLHQPAIEIKVMVDVGTVTLIITDQGCGIPRGEETKIFQPFYRALTPATEGIQGNGLGLSIVRRIVENHNGEIQIRPNSPQGTTVEIQLPRL